MMIKINNHLLKATKVKYSQIIDIVQPMLTKFDKYWGKMELFSSISLVFDPQHKLELIEFMCSPNSSSAQSTTIQPPKIKESLYQCYSETSASLLKKVTTQTPHSLSGGNKRDAQQKKQMMVMRLNF